MGTLSNVVEKIHANLNEWKWEKRKAELLVGVVEDKRPIYVLVYSRK